MQGYQTKHPKRPIPQQYPTAEESQYESDNRGLPTLDQNNQFDSTRKGI